MSFFGAIEGAVEGMLHHGGGQKKADAGHDAPAASQQAQNAAATAGPAEKQGAQAAGGKYKFQLLADSGAYLHGIPEGPKVGHAWVQMIGPDGKATSWGYWPKNPLKFWQITSSVPGCVRSPDNSHSPTAMHTYDVEAPQAQSAIKFATETSASPGDYNLIGHNCVHFATQMAQHAGVSPPDYKGLLGIANPGTLSQSIKALNANQHEDAMGRPQAAAAPPAKPNT